MRLCDFLRKINGDFTVRLYRKDNSILREDSLNVLNEEHKKDFSPLTGFKCKFCPECGKKLTKENFNGHEI